MKRENKMKLKSMPYEFGVEWIAMNDEPNELDWNEVSGFISVCLLADMFNLSQEKVAIDIVRFRKARNVEK